MMWPPWSVKGPAGIITGPRFLAARRLYGFAEYCVVTVSNGDGVLQIKTAHKGDIMATIPTDRLSYYSTTTDGGARLFVCTKGRSPLPSAEGEGGIPGQILALDPCVTPMETFRNAATGQRFALPRVACWSHVRSWRH